MRGMSEIGMGVVTAPGYLPRSGRAGSFRAGVVATIVATTASRKPARLEQGSVRCTAAYIEVSTDRSEKFPVEGGRIEIMEAVFAQRQVHGAGWPTVAVHWPGAEWVIFGQKKSRSKSIGKLSLR
jgi:hypothetical protein